MYIQKYFSRIGEMLERLCLEQGENMRRAAQKVYQTTVDGGMIYFFGATHAGILAQEAFYRTGGLVNINPILPTGLTCDVRPITATSQNERVDGRGAQIADEYGVKKGDLLFIHSVSGRNAVSVDMAIRARELGAYVVAITSLEYSKASSTRARCGKRLFEAADLVIDNCGVFGDACLEIEGFAGMVSPSSTVTGAAIVNAIVAESCGIFIENKKTPPVFVSANVDGGDAINANTLEEYKNRIIYN